MEQASGATRQTRSASDVGAQIIDVRKSNLTREFLASIADRDEASKHETILGKLPDTRPKIEASMQQRERHERDVLGHE
jgi:hypothetical protein